MENNPTLRIDTSTKLAARIDLDVLAAQAKHSNIDFDAWDRVPLAGALRINSQEQLPLPVVKAALEELAERIEISKEDVVVEGENFGKLWSVRFGKTDVGEATLARRAGKLLATLRRGPGKPWEQVWARHDDERHQLFIGRDENKSSETARWMARKCKKALESSSGFAGRRLHYDGKTRTLQCEWTLVVLMEPSPDGEHNIRLSAEGAERFQFEKERVRLLLTGAVKSDAAASSTWL